MYETMSVQAIREKVLGAKASRVPPEPGRRAT